MPFENGSKINQGNINFRNHLFSSEVEKFKSERDEHDCVYWGLLKDKAFRINWEGEKEILQKKNIFTKTRIIGIPHQPPSSLSTIHIHGQSLKITTFYIYLFSPILW